MIIPVILCGGFGKRLWPLSHKGLPKQFIKTLKDKSLFQHAVLNAVNISKENFLVIICNEEFKNLVLEQLKEIGIEHAHIILEPSSCNTAAAIAISSLYINKLGNYDILVLPADHHIEEIENLKKAVYESNLFTKDRIILFGIKPKYAETAYGYIKRGEMISTNNHLYNVDMFTEKPSIEVAEEYLNSGSYLWNSGISLFGADFLLNELKIYCKDVYNHAVEAFNFSLISDNIIYLPLEKYKIIQNISLDYALLEKTTNILVKEVDLAWNDLGSWRNFINIGEQDIRSNVSSGKVTLRDSSNLNIYAQTRHTIALGINNAIIVETPEAVLVASKNYINNLNELINNSQKDSREINKKYVRPWGYYEILSINEGFLVKLLTIKPNEQTSLQFHTKRSEHWIILDGEAEITLNTDIFTLKIMQSLYVPIGAYHRICNKQDSDLKIIEIQMGDYLEEDDVVRIEDKYGRNELMESYTEAV